MDSYSRTISRVEETELVVSSKLLKNFIEVPYEARVLKTGEFGAVIEDPFSLSAFLCRFISRVAFEDAVQTAKINQVHPLRYAHSWNRYPDLERALQELDKLV